MNTIVFNGGNGGSMNEYFWHKIKKIIFFFYAINIKMVCELDYHILNYI